MSRPAVFFDRDGTLSHEVGYVNHITRFQPFAFAVDAIRAVNAGNRLAVVVTNQAGVARGYFPESLIADVNGVLKGRAESSGARIDAMYYCPHHPSAGAPPYRQDCDCRKPRPGMLHRAATDHDIDLSKSWVIGDRLGDLELAWNVGARACLVKTGYGMGEIEYWMSGWKRQPDLIAENALDAALQIVEKY
jgi:D-glycero-D-manno-heptose 1,7-bisphosphate phosphatase